MKNSFPGYFRPSESEFDDLWKKSLFAFDASTLLNIYRYTPDTYNAFFDILKQLSGRIWIPHQAALEFHKNRLKVIRDQKDAYNKVKETIKKTETISSSELQQYKRHPHLDTNKIIEMLSSNNEVIIKYIEKCNTSHQDLDIKDDLRDILVNIFNGKVGTKYSQDEINTIKKNGQVRYAERIPPGYADQSKENQSQFGDLIIWHQLMDKAKSDNISILLVTDDRKEDWWETFQGERLGPRPELIHEMREKAGVSFYMYTPVRFIEYSQKYLKRKDNKGVIEEVQAVSDFIRTNVNIAPPSSSEDLQIQASDTLSVKDAITIINSYKHDAAMAIKIVEDIKESIKESGFLREIEATKKNLDQNRQVIDNLKKRGLL
jgi:hypothetical protein